MSNKKKFHIDVDTFKAIQYDSLDDFFLKYVLLQKPFHNLGEKECKVLAYIYKKKFELSSVILDNSILDKLVLNKENKREIITKCKDISENRFNVIMAKLRKLGIITLDSISPKYMPSLYFSEDGIYKLLYTFIPSSQEKESSNNTKRND